MLTNALIYLCAAVLSVPIAKRLGLGSVLGYLLAGVIIGPNMLHLVGDQKEVMHFAEFGVVLMLFLIGLELQPRRLWEMRKPILGLGGMQVLCTTVLITSALAMFTEVNWNVNLTIGMTLALSSTAIVIQSLSEKGLLNTQAGKNAFAVLLFQDIAIIPILALLPLLMISSSIEPSQAGHGSLIDHLPIWAQIAATILTILAIVIGGKFLSAPIFRFIAETRLREVFTAFALLLIIAIAVLMQTIGLSPALGTFLAGVVLAESEFRHELEVDIEPFKGLLLGLFFITIGASIDFHLLASHPLAISLAVIALFIAKASILAILAKSFNLGRQQGTLFTVALAQGGEFGFVIIAASTKMAILDQTLSNLLMLIVTLSMLISPFLLVAHERLMSRPQKTSSEPNRSGPKNKPIIIAGYGRFGQIVGRLLNAQGYEISIVDHSPGQLDTVQRFGSTVYYGDAARKELLEAAGAEQAQLLVIAVDAPTKTLEIIETARQHFPHLKIFARATDRRHAYELLRAHIEGFRRETFDSALRLGIDALKALGLDSAAAERAGEIFVEHDEQALIELAKYWGDDKSYGVANRQRMEDLEQVLQADQNPTQDSPAPDNNTAPTTDNPHTPYTADEPPNSKPPA